ncbi:RNA polymerase subunit sigma-70, partial [Idiomarina sp. HD9-110m-PIT-SAG04]
GNLDVSQLDKLILKLPEQTRQVFVLHALQGESHQQIADWLGIAPGTSKAQFHRARKRLEEWLQNE